MRITKVSVWILFGLVIYSVVLNCILLILYYPSAPDKADSSIDLQFQQLVTPNIRTVTGTNLTIDWYGPAYIQFLPTGDSDIIDTNKVNQGEDSMIYILILIKSLVETNIVIRLPNWIDRAIPNKTNHNFELISGAELFITPLRLPDGKVYYWWRVAQIEPLFWGGGTGYSSGSFGY